MQLGVLVGDFMKKRSLEDSIRLAKEMGYSCVEIPAYDIERKGRQYDKEEVKKVADWAKDLEIEAMAFMCHVGFTGENWQKCVEHTKRIIDIAQFARIKIVHTVSGILPQVASVQYSLESKEVERMDMSNTTEWGRMLQAYHEVLDYASDTEVRIAIEPVFVYAVCNYNTLSRLFKDLKRDDLYINLDFSHFPYHRESPIPVIKEFGQKIIHTHVKDAEVSKLVPQDIEDGKAWNMGNGEQFKFAAAGKGVLNWSEMISALKEIGYDYVLSLEMGHDYGEGPQIIAKENIVFFQKLLRSLTIDIR